MTTHKSTFGRWLVLGGLVGAIGARDASADRRQHPRLPSHANTPSHANANANANQTTHADTAEIARVLQHVKPDPHTGTASLRGPAWCTTHKPDEFYAGAVSRRYEEYTAHHYWNDLLQVAGMLCNGDPKDAVIQQAATEVVQSWMNATGLADADAVESLRARLDNARFVASKADLCKQLVVPAEVSGEDAAFMAARRALFGCDLTPVGGNNEGLWSEADRSPSGALPYLEQSSAVAIDEVVRLAYVTERAKLGNLPHNQIFDSQLAMYGVDAIDFRALSDQRVIAALDAAPYRGNVYARVMVKESLAATRVGIAMLGDEVAKRTTDADWKELLVDAPARGAALYAAQADKFKTELARSNAFEHAADGGSKKAVAGCIPQLHADVVAVLRTFAHARPEDVEQAMHEPVPALLIARLARCSSLDGDGDGANALDPSAGMQLRGPRGAAYLAMLQAGAKIANDRPKFPVLLDQLMSYGVAVAGATAAGRHHGRNDKPGRLGVIATTAKTADGVLITFKKERHQEMGQDCQPGNRLLGITSDGTLQYNAICKNTGLEWIDDTTKPITLPASLADGLAPGVILERNHDDRVVAWADKEHKKLVSYAGLAL